jgi:hypothetical protein
MTRLPLRVVRSGSSTAIEGKALMLRTFCGVIAAGFLLLNGAAEAQVLQRYNTGQWTIEANATNRVFQNCTATGRYGGGAQVIFMLTRNLVWGIGIENPRWNWTPQSQGDLTYWVDGRAPRTSRVRALTRTRLLILLADSRHLFEEIRRGNRMHFRPHGHNTFNITLVGTSIALNELMACVRRYR